jgi:hypothetical protein
MDLGSGAPFAVLGSTAITAPATVTVNGALGVSPGATLTGAPVVSGTTNLGNGVAALAWSAVQSVAAPPSGALIASELGAVTLTPGVYESATPTWALTTTLTLNGLGTYVFRCSETLDTAAASTVALTNGARSADIYWLIGTATTLGASSIFRGSVISGAAVSVGAGTVVDGRLFGGAAITLGANVSVSIPALVSARIAGASLQVNGSVLVDEMSDQIYLQGPGWGHWWL